VAIALLQPVQDLDATELALYRTLRRVEEHERAGVLVAANHKVIRRLLTSRYSKHSGASVERRHNNKVLRSAETQLRKLTGERAAAGGSREATTGN
jgi:hypothetical protein